jgi:hypothetical protein
MLLTAEEILQAAYSAVFDQTRVLIGEGKANG